MTDFTDKIRRNYFSQMGVWLVMTDNEIEEMTDKGATLAELGERSKRNADSIASARISYAGY